MEKLNIITTDGIEKEVDGLLYSFNSKYYLIYTEKELDENGYVILYLVQVARETINTPTGMADTGFMMGLLPDETEWKESVQNSISIIVEDKKQSTTNPQIQYFPVSSLSKVKINDNERKRFRLAKNIIEENFGLNVSQINEVDNAQPEVSISNIEDPTLIEQTPETFSEESQFTQEAQPVEQIQTESNAQPDVIVDYRTSFFEEQAKNAALQEEIKRLNEKLAEIKKVID